ncbi:SDR family NAD(P)-dependent oxidoreductase [Cytobacillus purgationiresistens]|uniref:NAD(P)-dependent dehydrogenase (Short-subunit alcohol dehydrogenase family) n=1 Tax=Cytobacillus purgationiresistens TaxID=863449 RepID=A0ABU0AEB9_9BACI|nr:SDR family NAD(P)-dependent oxidoreductase [Cytobacillus purgationiresistens]MDQ0269588.1 NAD(P)-dependent dehydrogenase (short-subunit alcohol dehydrogenase family) [Cytobacillus purgationiresistens]
MSILQNEVAVITGAGSGIGKQVAKLFAQEGASVVLVDRTSIVEKITKELIADGKVAMSILCDVTKENEVEESFETVMKQFGKVDIVIASAGIDQISPLHDTTLYQWKSVLDVNLTGVYLTNKFAVKCMLTNGQGSIVNISSILGHVGQKDITSYAASKGGVTNLTRSIAVTYADKGIRVNAVCPGYIETNLLKDLNDDMRKERIQRHPMQRMGTAIEVAEACLFLASKKASFITGTNLMVDGGYTAQ